MDLSRVIIGSVVTEKAERIKADRSYTLRVSADATKIDVKNALKKYFDAEVTTVRVMRVGTKARSIGPNKVFTKRHPFKKVIVTIAAKSKPLDLANFKAS